MSTLIRCAGLVDGTGRAPLLDAAIRIEGGRVKAVGPSGALRAQPGEQLDEHDFGGYFVCPGLIDEHTHLGLAGDGRTYEQMAEDPDEIMVLAGVRNLAVHLRAGVTTLRDNGARNTVGFAIREGANRGYFPSPRMLVCGRPIVATKGHFWWCNEEADGEAEIRRAVRRLVHEGADHIKVMASGGGTRGTIPGRASYSTAELRAAADEAHQLGRLTVVHCRAKESMVRAVEAGLDLMEHAEFLDPDGVMRYDAELAEAMRASGIWVSPTLQAAGYPTVLALRARREAERADRGRGGAPGRGRGAGRDAGRALRADARGRAAAAHGRRLRLRLRQPRLRPPRLRPDAHAPRRHDRRCRCSSRPRA